MSAIPSVYAFDRIIAPISVGTFLSEYHERRTLVVHRDQADYYKQLVTIADLDDFLSIRPLHNSQVSLVDARRDIAAEEYVSENEYVDVVRLQQLFAAGATMIFPHMDEHLKGLASICRGAEQVFNHPFQTNLYFTPPGAQGFKIHHDTHDVFVLQAAGSKRWRTYEPVVRLPLPGQTMDDPSRQWGMPVEEFTLHAGDIFYCPRGVPHDADATNEHSLHITFGALAYTWAEIMIESMADLCLNDPEFRAALPTGFATGPSATDARKIFDGLVQRFAQSARLTPALDRLAEEFILTRQPMVPDQRLQMKNLDTLTVHSLVGGRPGLIYRWSADAEAVTLLCHKNEISFPRHVVPTAAFVLNAARVRVADLPGELDDTGKLVLIRRLIAEGLVTTVD
jgi:ribosomal protein L16 Arg81 hydroxylase